MAKEQIEKKEVKLHVRIFIFCLTTILISFLFISNLYSQTGWFRQYSNNQLDFYSVYFINQNTGWVVGGREADEWGCIYKTTNGGTNWVVQWMGPNNFRYSVCFADQNTGWVVGCTSTFKGTIYNTINGGTNWFSQWSDTTCSVFCLVQFKTLNLGWAANWDGTFVKTTDAGASWIKKNTGPGVVGTFFFIDQNTGWACRASYLVKTIDGGENWSVLSAPGSSLGSIFFIDNNTGWIAGNPIFKTTNSGINWVSEPLTISNLHSIFFADHNNGWAVGGSFAPSYITKTTNGGANWMTQTIQNILFLRSVYFTDQNTGWVVGSEGTILKTTTGGSVVGITPVSNEIPGTFSLSINYPNPFNPGTTIEFTLPKTSFAKLIIYDVPGKEIETLVNEELKAGKYKVDFQGGNLSSGIYFYSLITNEYTAIRKMVLIK